MSPSKPEFQFGSNFKGGSLFCADGTDLWFLFRLEFNIGSAEELISPGSELNRWNITPAMAGSISLAGRARLRIRRRVWQYLRAR